MLLLLTHVDVCTMGHCELLSNLRSYTVHPHHVSPEFNIDGSAIGVVLYTETFYVHRSAGDDKIKPDGKNGCPVSWNKYPDVGEAFLGTHICQTQETSSTVEWLNIHVCR